MAVNGNYVSGEEHRAARLYERIIALHDREWHCFGWTFGYAAWHFMTFPEQYTWWPDVSRSDPAAWHLMIRRAQNGGHVLRLQAALAGLHDAIWHFVQFSAMRNLLYPADECPGDGLLPWWGATLYTPDQARSKMLELIEADEIIQPQRGVMENHAWFEQADAVLSQCEALYDPAGDGACPVLHCLPVFLVCMDSALPAWSDVMRDYPAGSLTQDEAQEIFWGSANQWSNYILCGERPRLTHHIQRRITYAWQFPEGTTAEQMEEANWVPTVPTYLFPTWGASGDCLDYISSLSYDCPGVEDYDDEYEDEGGIPLPLVSEIQEYRLVLDSEEHEMAVFEPQSSPCRWRIPPVETKIQRRLGGYHFDRSDLTESPCGTMKWRLRVYDESTDRWKWEYGTPAGLGVWQDCGTLWLPKDMLYGSVRVPDLRVIEKTRCELGQPPATQHWFPWWDSFYGWIEKLDGWDELPVRSSSPFGVLFGNTRGVGYGAHDGCGYGHNDSWVGAWREEIEWTIDYEEPL